jgi:hypothetical protein
MKQGEEERRRIWIEPQILGSFSPSLPVISLARE